MKANRNIQFDELVSYFSNELRWDVETDKIVADNLVIYFRESFNEYRLRDISNHSGMDLTSINFPLDADEKARLWEICSRYFKSSEPPLTPKI
jgi:hypothetical protein